MSLSPRGVIRALSETLATIISVISAAIVAEVAPNYLTTFRLCLLLPIVAVPQVDLTCC